MELLFEDFARAGQLCEAAVADLVSAYSRGAEVKEALLDKTRRVQRIQDEADEVAAEIIARLKPEASDLRFVKSCQKLTLEFSRLVRYAYDISDFVTRRHATDAIDEEVKKVADRTRRLIEVGVRSMQTKDLVLGEELRQMRTPLRRPDTDADSVRATSSALFLRFLEGVSAHIVSIGDSVRYIATGENS